MLADWYNICRWGPNQLIALKFALNKFNLFDTEKKSMVHSQNLSFNDICNSLLTKV